MSRTRSNHRRRLVAGLAPFALVLGALPLLAPTCGDPGEGFKTFSRNSIIIPMDVCYQRQTDGTGITYTPAPTCPQTPDTGDVIRAYGLVYQLIRNDIAVYWVINNEKTAIDAIDFSVSYSSGFPSLYYDWTPEDPPPATPPTTAHTIDYRGGPFVVDGSDFARASAVLQNFRATFQNVNVHVSNVAFRAYAKRTMAGGWSAGGTVAPKVALLDIGSTSGGYAKNSEPIIRGYLARAGLDFPGAGGVATDTGHGQIYDRLGMADLQPTTPGGSWTTTNLAKYGYQILWVPHWFAPGSCANASSQTACVGSLYPLAQRDQALTTVGAFVAAGKDLFAECAGLGSFEGQASGATGWSTSYSDGDPTTHFHVTNGLEINKNVGTAVYDAASVTSPLLQLGDYPFRPRTGAIQNYRPAPGRTTASTYTSVPPAADGVARLFTDQADPTYDYFTYRPPGTGRGTTVYLGGHVYSGYSDTLGTGGTLQLDASSFAIGGTRLVLNTLFNLGAACTASGVACNTGQAGVCAQGTIQCQGTPAVPVCTPLPTSTPTDEICNGLDDDCDWEVDEGLETACYDLGLADPTVNVGLCRAGISSCVKNPDDTYSMSACVGQVLPATEVCNALDDDCDGSTDEGLTQTCYEGPSSSLDPTTGQPRPICAAGTQTCTLGSWGACVGQILPRPEICSEGAGTEQDDDCNGVVNDGCACTDGATVACYTGPVGTNNVGACHGGTQTCTGGAWGSCVGQVLPSTEVCGNGVDDDCNGSNPVCPGCTSPAAPVGGTAPCNSLASFPGALPNTGQCQDGTMTCAVDNTWGSCLGEILPSPIETCDNVDNDCDGAVDDGAICPTSFVCLSGVCVPDACGVEVPPPEGYACDPDGVGGTDPNGEVIPGDCGGTGPCVTGQVCRFGTCVAPCTADQCATGSLCGGGACIAGACYATGCPSGQLCREGACVADPCQGVLCPGGTFCREGDCVQACTFVSCLAGERCGEDGFCVPDPCAGVTCGPGERCTGGTCAANPCATRGCAAGQVCTVDAGGAALCVDDPCAGITCPAGACSGGQCFSTANPTGQGSTPPGPGESDSGCGCGSGAATALPGLLALLAAPLARRRRRSGGRGIAGKLALLVAASTLLGSACKKDEEPFDPATCAETCGEQRCVDVEFDAAHCGACGAACGTGEICVDAVCGPASAVAPFITTLSPSSGPPGSAAPVTVQLTGARFAAGATVRATVGSGTRTFPTTFVSSSQLSADLDLSAAAAGRWRLRVVNPDKVISNAVNFEVVVPAPFLTGLEGAVTAGQTSVVLLTGTGFTTSSQGHLRSVDGSVPDFGLPSVVDGAGVHCTIDATALPPGPYEIWVVNEGGLASNVLTLLVSSDVAELLSLSPSSGAASAPVTITVTGSGFDLSSRVLFDGCAGPNDPAGCSTSALLVGTSFVDSTRLTAALTLPTCGGTCPHSISVRNGSGATTGTLVFTVASDQPTISTFSPATAYQGENPVTLTFTGTGFPVGTTTIEVQPPGGVFAAITTGAVSCPTSCTVSGTMSLAGQPEGSWLARLDYGGGLISAAWPFRVLSNQAILQSLSPRSGAQGTSPSATVAGANLRPPFDQIRVRFRNAAGSVSQALVPSPTPTSSNFTFNVAPNLTGLDTGTYSVAIENPPIAAASNALSFTVTPGQPTVTAVCRLEGPSCAATNPNQAQQGPTPVPVRITGTNFAKPDASGNGSTVMVTANIMPGWPTACPSAPASPPFQPVPGTVEVVSPTEIVVQLDTLSALAGTTYYVAVWNPGGVAPPQESYPCATPLPGALPAFTVLP